MRLRFACGLAPALLALGACGETPPPAAVERAAAEFVGSAGCAGCHAKETADWTGSHHDLAMQIADETSVLGDFADAEFEYFGETAAFFREAGKFVVRTLNGEGEVQDFAVTHTFGLTPLQQYLVEFPGGRLQALPFAWDTRPAGDGGQRWFHLYGDEYIGPDDELHWTGRQQNWNYMCAECHSTDLRVNYEPASDSFSTAWAEMNVGCEACHGPASNHVAEANSGDFSSTSGLVVDLDDQGRAVWQMNPETGIAQRSEMAMQQSRQPEACGRCHSRRGVISADYEYGRPLADTHRVALLDPPLYFDDGQIRDEVYVYGSFLQSRMYQAGVSCSNCHNPHSLELLTGTEPSDVCSGCHLPTTFATREHHRHAPAEVSCVDCHMPARTYMQVDGRRDHSFRIPRPDLSSRSNAPNACNQCHTGKDADWASAAARQWWGDAGPHFAIAFAAARKGAGNRQLVELFGQNELTGIVRATSLTMLASPPGRAESKAIQKGLGDPDPLVRMAAIGAALMLAAESQLQFLPPLLGDSVRSVRIEAARVLAPLHEYLPVNAGFGAAAREFRAAQMAVASRPEAHIALGDFESSLGNETQAMQHYRFALDMDAAYPESRLNYADALRRFGDEAAAETVLREGLEIQDDNADLRHSLGLLLVRTDRSEEGLDALRRAAELAPDNVRYTYVLGIALNSLGRAEQALRLLQQAHQRFPGDFDIAWALATLLRDRGDNDAARRLATELASQRPDDPNVQALLRSLDAA